MESNATKQIGAMAAIAGSTWGFSLIDMRKVYLGAVVPQVFFGSSIWLTPGPAGSGIKATQDKILQILTKIQKRAAALIAGAFRTTAGTALDIELFIPPVQQQLERLNGFALTRIMGSPVEPRIKESRTHQNRPCNLWSPLQRLQHQFTQIFNTLQLNQESMEVVTPFVVAPWWEPPEVQIAHNKEEALKNHDITTLCSPPNTTFIYTDGGGLEDRVGAAAVEYNPRLDGDQPQYKAHCLRKASKACLGTLQNSTVFAGELKGIDMALDITPWKAHTDNIVIFTDNQATLQQIADPKWCSGQVYLDSIVKKLESPRDCSQVLLGSCT